MKVVACLFAISFAAGCASVSAEKRAQVDTAQNALQNSYGYEHIQRRNNAQAMAAQH